MTTPPTSVSNGDLVRRLFAALDGGDLEALRACWTPQTIERMPDRTYHGADAIAAYFETAFAAMPDLRAGIISLMERDDDVIVHWQITGTHSGAPFQGIDATGRRIALDGFDHFTIRDGMIVSNFVVFDQMQFARAIGLLPPDGSRADRAMKAAFNAKTRLAQRVRRR